MNNYEINCSINGKRTVQVVAANTSHDAKELLKAQYPGAKISVVNIKQLKK